MDNTEIVDVVIVGAGPTGLTLASDLMRLGVNFRIFDQKLKPEEYSKASNLWSRTQEIAAAIGFLDKLLSKTLELHTAHIYAYGKYMGCLPTGSKPSPYSEPLATHQGFLEQTLVNFLNDGGQNVDYDNSVVNVHQSSDYITVTVKRDCVQETVCCRYLVACDGNRSVIREMAGFSLEETSLPVKVIRQIDSRVRWSHGSTNDQLFFFLFDNGYTGVIPLPDGYYRCFICQDEQQIPERQPTLAEMETSLMEVIQDPLFELYDPVWFSYGKFRSGVATEYQKGRIFLAGDAGHVSMPIGAQGMNSGMQDAFNLGWKLAAVLQGRAKPSLLKSYAIERHQVHSEIAQAQTDEFNRLMCPNWLQKKVMGLFGPFILSRQKGVELSKRDESHLAINYPISPLTKECLDNHGVRAGDRAPDARVVGLSSLVTTQLFKFIYNDTWTLFVFQGKSNNIVDQELYDLVRTINSQSTEIRAFLLLVDSCASYVHTNVPILLDLEFFAHKAYKIKKPSIFIIRPDGYIGYRGKATAIDQVFTYLNKIFDQQLGSFTKLI
jgi:3-(3-hydroxy-phenyl)propionate hydroxylase